MTDYPTNWVALGNSTNNGIYGGQAQAIAMNGTNNLFVGGYFNGVAGGSLSVDNIASWDGNSWNRLGNATNNGIDGGTHNVNALAMNGTNNLFVGVHLQKLQDIQFQPIILHLGMEIHGIYWEQIQQIMELMELFMLLQ